MTLPAQATVIATLAKLLEEEGFQPFGRTWRRQRPESIHVVSVQAMGSGRRMFLNAGVYLREMGGEAAPAEHDCHIRIGAEDIASRPLMPSSFSTSTSTGRPCVSQPARRGT